MARRRRDTRGQNQAVIDIRRATAEDASFLHEMLAVAADWRREAPRPTMEVLAEPAFARYVADWPRDGDLGLIAEEGTIPVGAVWWRTFTQRDPGYGFVDEYTPELSIGVLYPLAAAVSAPAFCTHSSTRRNDPPSRRSASASNRTTRRHRCIDASASRSCPVGVGQSRWLFS